MTVVIIDYGSGNLRSAAKAFERTSDGTIFPHRFSKVLATGRLEPAVPAQQRAEQQAVGGDQPEKY